MELDEKNMLDIQKAYDDILNLTVKMEQHFKHLGLGYISTKLFECKKSIDCCDDYLTKINIELSFVTTQYKLSLKEKKLKEKYLCVNEPEIKGLSVTKKKEYIQEKLMYLDEEIHKYDVRKGELEGLKETLLEKKKSLLRNDVQIREQSDILKKDMLMDGKILIPKSTDGEYENYSF